MPVAVPLRAAPGSFLLKRGLRDHEGDVVDLVKDLLGRAAVAKLLLDDAVKQRQSWARDYYTKRYATLPKPVRSYTRTTLTRGAWSGTPMIARARTRICACRREASAKAAARRKAKYVSLHALARAQQRTAPLTPGRCMDTRAWAAAPSVPS